MCSHMPHENRSISVYWLVIANVSSLSSESMQTTCVKLKPITEASSCDSVKCFLSHLRGFFSSVPQVLWVKSRFISCGPELFIFVIMLWSRNIFFPKCHQGARNLHIHTIRDFLPAVLPPFSSCNSVSFSLDVYFLLYNC